MIPRSARSLFPSLAVFPISLPALLSLLFAHAWYKPYTAYAFLKGVSR